MGVPVATLLLRQTAHLPALNAAERRCISACISSASWTYNGAGVIGTFPPYDECSMYISGLFIWAGESAVNHLANLADIQLVISFGLPLRHS